MYCSHCGAEAAGNFCASCGNRLIASNDSTPQTPSETFPADWSETTDCDLLLRIPEVRSLVESYASRSKSKMTGEQFLEVADKILSPLTAGVPLSPLAKVGQSMYAKMGVKTGKARREFLPLPVGRVIVRTLCSLAQHGQELLSATPATDGCLLKANLPSDMWSFAGNLIVTLERVNGGTQVEACTDIPGQLFDWGKSTRCLETLFDELRAEARAA